MEVNILEHQQTAGVIKMMAGSMVTMLPYLSYGCIQSYFTTGLPKLMKANQMGILLDLYQMSWISMCLSYSWTFKLKFKNDSALPRFHGSTEPSFGHLFLWLLIRQNWEKEESHSCQHPHAHVSFLCLLLHFIPQPGYCSGFVYLFLQHGTGEYLLHYILWSSGKGQARIGKGWWKVKGKLVYI